jgi:glycosyltransferase involved in cell wall biosynthesis
MPVIGPPRPAFVSAPGPPDVLDLSIVVPAYDEEANVGPLYREIMEVVPRLGLRFEIVFVDDGSRDATFARLAELAAGDPRVRVVKLARNYGQTPAMVAGIDHARGRVLVTMDADLQNDPADIAKLLARLDEGFDLVVGWRRERRDTWLSRTLPSQIANRLIAVVTGVDVKDNGCTLKAFRAELIRTLPLYADMHRFIPAMASLGGARLAELAVNHRPRLAGTSKYGLTRVYKVLLDLIAVKSLIVFGRRPLHCFAGAAASSLMLSLMCFIVALLHLQGEGGSLVVFMGLSVLLGSLAIFLGFLGMIGAVVYHYLLDPSAGRFLSVPWLAADEI